MGSYLLSGEPSAERYPARSNGKHSAAGANIDEKLQVGEVVDTGAARGNFTLRLHAAQPARGHARSAWRRGSGVGLLAQVFSQTDRCSPSLEQTARLPHRPQSTGCSRGRAALATCDVAFGSEMLRTASAAGRQKYLRAHGQDRAKRQHRQMVGVLNLADTTISSARPRSEPP
jgi:hypothetical protein